MSFADKLKKFTNDAVEKGKGLAEQGKLSLDNQKQLDAIKHAQQLIGAYVAENNLLAEDEYIMSQLSAIAAANEIMEKNSSRIAELKAAGAAAADEAADAIDDAVSEAEAAVEKVEETVQRAFCPECGKEVDPGARFCPSCGKPLA
jgi:NADH pyrophosphatase NudC (nudix superfamily)